jgi:hypothetical protein
LLKIRHETIVAVDPVARDLVTPLKPMALPFFV